MRELPTPLALPASANLFFGLCQLLQRKAEYLLVDSVDAQFRFRVGSDNRIENITLPATKLRAKKDNITLPLWNEQEFLTLEYLIPQCTELEHLLKDAQLLSDVDNMVDIARQEWPRSAAVQPYVAQQSDITLDNVTDASYVGDLHASFVVDDIDIGSYMLDSAEGSQLAGLISLPENDAISMQIDAPEIEPMDIDPIDLIEPVEFRSSRDRENSINSLKRTRKRLEVMDVYTTINDRDMIDAIQNLSCHTIERPQKLMRPNMRFSSLLCDTLSSMIEAARTIKVASRKENDSSSSIAYRSELLPSPSHGAQSYAGGSEVSVEHGRANANHEEIYDDLLADDDHSTFLGQRVDLHESPAPSRMSLASLGSPQSNRRSTIINRSRSLLGECDRGEEFDTPDINVTVSQFYIPEMIVPRSSTSSRSESRFSKDRDISAATRVFRNFVEECVANKRSSMVHIEGSVESDGVSFNEVLEHALPHATVTKHDASVAFLQVLVLRTLNIVDVRQDIPYGPIVLQEDVNIQVSFSSSQLYAHE